MIISPQKGASTFLRELLVLYRDSRVLNGVGKKGGNHVRLILGYQSSWFVRGLAVSFGGFDIWPMFLGTKTPEVVVFVENALPHAAIACIWC